MMDRRALRTDLPSTALFCFENPSGSRLCCIPLQRMALGRARVRPTQWHAAAFGGMALLQQPDQRSEGILGATGLRAKDPPAKRPDTMRQSKMPLVNVHAYSERLHSGSLAAEDGLAHMAWRANSDGRGGVDVNDEHA